MKKYVLAVAGLSATAWLAYAATMDQPGQEPGTVTVASSSPTGTSGGTAMFAGAPAQSSSANVAEPVASSLQDPSTIIGLKLKFQPFREPHPWELKNEASENQWRTTLFETGDLTYKQFCEAMKAKGVTGITLRIPNDVLEFTERDGYVRPTWPQIYNQFGLFIKEAYKAGLPVYLWQRVWFKHPTNENFEIATPELIDRIREIVRESNQHVTNGVSATRAISGIILTEPKETDGAKLRYHALKFARDVNNAPQLGDFLKNRTLVFPGGDMGAEFSTIRKGLDGPAAYQDFYSKMRAQTGYFAWSFKFFGDFEKHPSYELLTTQAQITAFLRTPDDPTTDEHEGLGLNQLKSLVNWGKANGYPNQSHVIFWGDTADTIANLSTEERAAVKDVLVTQNNWRGHLFNLAIANQGDTLYDLQDKANFFWPTPQAYSSPSQLIPHTFNDSRNRVGRPGKLHTAWANWLN